jgi:serine/threonine-protein kinase
MAKVSLGRMVSPAGIGRTVAIKQMHPQLAAEPSFAAMFFDEARLAMRIQHPNVVATFDVVIHEDELLLVMEYIHGESLAGLCRKARAAGEQIPPRIASSIIVGLLSGLHAAHEAKSESGEPLSIVHRDVSPQNVIVGVDGVARVLDFGIAKAMGRTQTTQQGELKGKFGYMAPEQLTNGAIDRRVDVWAGGVVLWEALAGQRLFQGDNAGALVRAVLDQPIQKPSEWVLGLPPAVDDVVLRALARQKMDRFETARAMAVAIEEAIAPATAREVGEWVERTAAASLAERAALVDEVESAAAGRVAAPRIAAPPHADEISSDRIQSEELTEASQALRGAALATTHLTLSPPRKVRRPWLTALASGVGAVSLAFVFMAARRSDSAASPSAPDRAAPGSAPVAPSVAAPPSTAPVPEAKETAAASATAAAAPARTGTSAPAPPRAARGTGAAPRKVDCTNPFLVDARGIRVPRPECF